MIGKLKLRIHNVFDGVKGLKVLRTYRSDDSVMGIGNSAKLLDLADAPCTHFADEDLMSRTEVHADGLYNAHRCIIALGSLERIILRV